MTSNQSKKALKVVLALLLLLAAVSAEDTTINAQTDATADSKEEDSNNTYEFPEKNW